MKEAGYKDNIFAWLHLYEISRKGNYIEKKLASGCLSLKVEMRNNCKWI